MTLPRHDLDPMLDVRLVAYAGRSWNAQRAVYCLQQMVSLMPRFVTDVGWLRQATGLEQAQHMWGIVADLAGAMTGLPPTADTLAELGFDEIEEVGSVTAFESDMALAGSPVLTPLNFDSANPEDITAIFRRALDHDLIAKPLMIRLQDDVRSFHPAIVATASQLDDAPVEFPFWDGRPLFIEEQQAVLLYLARNIAAEIVVDHLADEALGEYLLRRTRAIHRSAIVGESIFDLNAVPLTLLNRPVAVVCHELGDVALQALRAFGDQADVLDVLYVVEAAVRAEVGIDISLALTPTRNAAMEQNMRSVAASVIDLRCPMVSTLDVAASSRATPYTFPHL